ncbi:MAG: hypothetical protein LH614_09225 [Pyrinomonadaceae bacterium]|nr:hypothetical protein [Pyrinomonadaceae bacterium]
MKLKLIKFVALWLFLLAANTFQVLAQSQNIFGVFKQCPFACRFIKINRDFTFEQLLDGDLFNHERTKGTWKFVGDNKIKAQSPRPSGEPQVKETSENRNNFLVIVADSAGAVVPSAEVSGESNGKSFKCVTTEDGSCEIPKAEKFDVAFASYRGTHKVKDASADVFLVQLTYDKLEPIIDEVWLIEKNRLFVANSDGTFDKEIWLGKVSRKKAKKLFP